MADVLTADELLDYRNLVGDTELDTSGAYILSDAEIETLWQNSQGNHVLTVVYYLRRVLGYSRRMIGRTNNPIGVTDQYQQLFSHTLEMLKYYTELYKFDRDTELAEVIGAGNKTGVGVLNLDIDYTTDDLDNGY